VANPYFKFKQFTVYHQHCAMKVSTDACLLGAIAAMHVKNNATGIYRMLDIGTGSGLLSLMLAQQHLCITHAVELDEKAASQAADNFSASPFAKYLQVFCTDIAHYHPPHCYDFIISNPPFFENDLQSPDTAKNKAMHSSHLTIGQLLLHIKRLSTPSGSAMVLLPWNRAATFLAMASQLQCYCLHRWDVRQSPAHQWFRSILLLSAKQQAYQHTAIDIKSNEQQYSPAFTQLLKPYYLYL
jgi:tRNA1Val (adenine37-N6)-methyltransferase